MNGRFCVYSFRAVIVDFTIKAHFLNAERFRKSGADHSMASRLRQDWAINLVHHYNSHIDRNNYQVFWDFFQKKLPSHDIYPSRYGMSSRNMITFLNLPTMDSVTLNIVWSFCLIRPSISWSVDPLIFNSATIKFCTNKKHLFWKMHVVY